MKNIKVVTINAIVASLLIGALSGCSTDAEVASNNLSMAADNFQIERRIVFINTWTDTYLLSITGLCSIKNGQNNTGVPSAAVTCKTSDTEYKKHYLALTGNVSYFSEQMGPAHVGVYRYKVVFKPSVIIPDIDLR